MASDKPSVIYLSLDKSKTFNERHDLLTREINKLATLREAVTQRKFFEYCTDPKLIGVIVTDATTIESASDRNKLITEKLVTLVKDKGVTVIYGCDFPRKMFSLERVPESKDDLEGVFKPEPGSHLVNVRDVEKYMKRNWGESWCPDDYPRDDSYFHSEQSSLYDILKENAFNVTRETSMRTLPIRQVKYESQQVMVRDPCFDASAVAFMSYGKGYVGMTAPLQRYVAMIPIYIAMLGFWGREGVRKKEAENKARRSKQ